MKRYYTVIEVLDALAETPGTNAKIDILRDVKNCSLDAEFQQIAVAALSPFNVYGIKQIPEFERFDMYGDEGSMTTKQILDTLESFKNRIITGNRASEMLSKMLELADPEYQEVIVRIIQKDLKCGVSAKTINKVWPNLIPVYPCMLCVPYSDKALDRITFPAIVQLKEDGMRANIVVKPTSVQVLSRSGKLIEINTLFLDLQHNLQAAGNSAYVLDGELVVMSENGETYLPRTASNGIINKKALTEDELNRIRFVCWDVIPYQSFQGLTPTAMAYRDRWNWLVDNFNGTHSQIALATSQIVEDRRAAMEFYAEQLSQGLEGAIIKNLDSVWANRRSPDMVKLKLKCAIDLEVTKAVEGSGQFSGKMGALELVSSDGSIVVSVGTGFSPQQRAEFWENRGDLIGKIVEIEGNDLVSSKSKSTLSITHPVFIEFRQDKDQADDKSKIQTIFAAARLQKTSDKTKKET